MELSGLLAFSNNYLCSKLIQNIDIVIKYERLCLSCIYITECLKFVAMLKMGSFLTLKTEILPQLGNEYSIFYNSFWCQVKIKYVSSYLFHSFVQRNQLGTDRCICFFFCLRKILLPARGTWTCPLRPHRCLHFGMGCWHNYCPQLKVSAV
jgi:hypothetical protein